MFGDRGRDGEEGQERNVEEGVAGKRFSDEEGERGRRDELFEVEEPEGDVVSNTRFLCGGQACTIKVRGACPCSPKPVTSSRVTSYLYLTWESSLYLRDPKDPTPGLRCRYF